VAEVCICYTGDVTSPKETIYTVDYYTELAGRIAAAGAHFICIKDMAGLMKPQVRCGHGHVASSVFERLTSLCSAFAFERPSLPTRLRGWLLACHLSVRSTLGLTGLRLRGCISFLLGGTDSLAVERVGDLRRSFIPLLSGGDPADPCDPQGGSWHPNPLPYARHLQSDAGAHLLRDSCYLAS
jgi:hypothetical protein